MTDFVAHVLDLLRPWGGVAARRMFSGHGLFRDGVMFALIADDTLCFKVDDANRASFAEAGMAPFSYDGKGKRVALPYWECPPYALDEGAALIALGRGALAAALRARAAKPAPTKAKAKQRR